MKSFGMQMCGQFVVEKIQTLPTFTSYDEGRFVYIYDEDSYYIGGILQWVRLTKSGSLLDKRDLNFGTSQYQINANCIPVQDKFQDFNNPENIYECLRNLSNGVDLKDGSIDKRHIGKRRIDKTHLNSGFEEDQISAHSILCKNRILNYDSPEISSIQDYMDQLSQLLPYVIRQKIQLSAWMYNIVDESFTIQVSYNPIKGKPPIVQCWDESNCMYLPSKVQIDSGLKRVIISSPYKLIMTVVIMG